MFDAPNKNNQATFPLCSFLGFCIDPNCKNPQKFLCNDCIFDNHNGHKIVRLKLINEILNNEKLNSQISQILKSQNSLDK